MFTLPNYRTFIVLALSISLAPLAWAQDDEPAQLPPTGRIVDATTGIRDFAPSDGPGSGESIIDARAINIRRLFEELGEEPTLWFQHVQTLANPIFEGRAPGTRGGELAQEYIRFYFDQYGLEPAFAAASEEPGGASSSAAAAFTQNFDFAAPSPEVKVLASEMSINGQALLEGVDYAVLPNSASAGVSAPLVWVGYALEEGQDGYTSFDEDTKLDGRIAIMLRYEPLKEDGTSLWSESRFSRYAAITPKMRAAAERGAAGIILVNPPGAVDGKRDLESSASGSRFGRRLDIPVFQLSDEDASALLVKADPSGRDLATWRRLSDTNEVKTVPLSDSVVATLSAELEVDDRLETCNVGATLRGQGDLADQWIVIGAHYDHVGYGYTGASPENVGKLHPGADDNASGTAGLLLAAEKLAKAYGEAPADQPLRSIMFVAFGAEEAGLHGSKYFVEHCPIPAQQVNLMINMDMIGRLRNDSISLQGLSTAENLEQIISDQLLTSGLTVTRTPGGRGPSDHASFYNAGIPVLFFFTGTHSEYHKPEDVASTVNPVGAVRIVNLITNVVMAVSQRTEKLVYVMTNEGGGRGGGPSGGSRVRLGIQPGYSAELETGVLAESVSDGTSAADAGIKAGDILLSWNSQEIADGRTLFQLLSEANPGDQVTIVYSRGGVENTTTVTLKSRDAE